MIANRIDGFVIIALAALAGSSYLVLGQLTNRTATMKPGIKDVEKSKRLLTRNGAEDERIPLTDLRAVSGTGVIEPRQREVKLAGPGAGQLDRVLVREGQTVQQGQLLIELESRAERAALRSAEEDLQKALRDLERVQVGERPETVAAMREDWRAAEAKSQQSKDTVARLSLLAANDLVTRDEFDRARSTAASDAALASAAMQRFASSASGPRDEEVRVQRSVVSQARRKIEERQAALALRRVLSPLHGTVLQIKYREGEYYLPGGEALLLLGDLSVRRARIDIDERDIARVHMGQSGFVTAPGFRDQRFPGRVVELGQRIGRKNIRSDDPKERIDTKILEVVLELDPAPELLPGLRVMAVLGGKEMAR